MTTGGSAGRILLGACTAALFLLAAVHSAFSGGIGISTDVEDLTEATTYTDEFVPVRPRHSGTLAYRDLRMHWDHLYDTGPSDSLQMTIDWLGLMLADTTGHNPFGASLSDIHLAYEYFRVAGAPAYSTNPFSTLPFRTDTLQGFVFNATAKVPIDTILGDMMPLAERTHIDFYIYQPGHDDQTDGTHPSQFLSMKEDSNSTNWRSGTVDTADVYPGNSLMFPGPGPSVYRFDMTGTGWTGPNTAANWGFIHEFVHALEDSSRIRSVDEFFSSAAEAVTGDEEHTFSAEVPYRWNLFTPDNYQHWRLFGAYLA